jgi:hypothetical protein
MLAQLAAVTPGKAGRGGPGGAALEPAAAAPALPPPLGSSPMSSAPSSASTSPLARSGAKRSAPPCRALGGGVPRQVAGSAGAGADAVRPRDQRACALQHQESSTAPCAPPPLWLPAGGAANGGSAGDAPEPTTPQEADRLAAAAAASLDAAASSPGAASGSDAGNKGSRVGSPEPGASLSRPGSASSTGTEVALHLPPPALDGLPGGPALALAQLQQLQQQQLLLAYEQLSAAGLAPSLSGALGGAAAAHDAGGRHALNAVPPGVIGTFFPVVWARPGGGGVARGVGCLARPRPKLRARALARRALPRLRPIPPRPAPRPAPRPQPPAAPVLTSTRLPTPPSPTPRSAPARRRRATKSTLPSASWRSASAPPRSGP